MFGNYKEENPISNQNTQKQDFLPTYKEKKAAEKKQLDLYGYELEKAEKLPFTYDKEGVGNERNALEKKIAGFYIYFSLLIFVINRTIEQYLQR